MRRIRETLRLHLQAGLSYGEVARALKISKSSAGKYVSLARAAGVEERRDQMCEGEHINITEDRAVMHMALRYQGDKPVPVDGKDVMPDVRGVLAAIETYTGFGYRRDAA